MPVPSLLRRPAPERPIPRRSGGGAALLISTLSTALRSRSLFLTSLAMALAEGIPAIIMLVGTAALNALLPGAEARRPSSGALDDFDASIPAIR